MTTAQPPPTDRLHSVPGIGSPLWLQWEPCRVKVNGRVREAWLRPGLPQLVTKAQARRWRVLLNKTVRQLPPGPYVGVMLDNGGGFRTVPESALRPYRGPAYRIPSHYEAADRAKLEARLRAALRKQERTR
jgi:hypothetical protein